MSDNSFKAPVGGRKTFPPAPAGNAQGVLADIIDRGFRITEYMGQKKVQRKVQLIFFLNKLDEEGNPFRVQNLFTFNMGDRAALRKFVQQALGQEFASDEEAEDFDTETMVGSNFLLNIVHRRTDHATYANISSIMPVMEGMPLIAVPDDYKRQYKNYAKSFQPNFDSPGDSRKLTDEQVLKLNAMPNSIRRNLVAAIDSVVNETNPNPSGCLSQTGEVPTLTPPRPAGLSMPVSDHDNADDDLPF